jgi:hypothetical protein
MRLKKKFRDCLWIEHPRRLYFEPRCGFLLLLYRGLCWARRWSREMHFYDSRFESIFSVRLFCLLEAIVHQLRHPHDSSHNCEWSTTIVQSGDETKSHLASIKAHRSKNVGWKPDSDAIGEWARKFHSVSKHSPHSFAWNWRTIRSTGTLWSAKLSLFSPLIDTKA